MTTTRSLHHVWVPIQCNGLYIIDYITNTVPEYNPSRRRWTGIQQIFPIWRLNPAIVYLQKWEMPPSPILANQFTLQLPSAVPIKHQIRACTFLSCSLMLPWQVLHTCQITGSEEKEVLPSLQLDRDFPCGSTPLWSSLLSPLNDSSTAGWFKIY